MASTVHGYSWLKRQQKKMPRNPGQSAISIKDGNYLLQSAVQVAPSFA